MMAAKALKHAQFQNNPAADAVLAPMGQYRKRDAASKRPKSDRYQ